MMNPIPFMYYDRKMKMRCYHDTLRSTFDPFDVSDRSFFDMYRMSKPLARELIAQIAEHDWEVYDNPQKIPLHLQVLATLHFLGSRSFQKRVGKDAFCTLSQSCVSKIINKICSIVSQKLAPVYVRFPKTTEEANDIKDGFVNKYGVPGIVGLIDGTHVALANLPKTVEAAYVNRKNFKSINVQAVVDSNMRFLNANGRYPGSTHDSLIWRSSAILPTLLDLHRQNEKTWILGDSGYGLQNYLIVPYRTSSNITEEETFFNDIHAKIRCLVERAFGVLKGRWRCLMHSCGYLHYSHKNSVNIIYTCITLHNFLLHYNFPIEDGVEISNEEFDENDFCQPSLQSNNSSRNYLQRYIIEQWDDISHFYEHRI